MKIYTIQDIRRIGPCYDPAIYLPEDWKGTLADILRVEACPANDRIWVAIRLLDFKANRLFAVWCARHALSLVENIDHRSITACDVAERYTLGLATRDELMIAAEAALGAVWSWSPERSAAAETAASFNAVWVDFPQTVAWDVARRMARSIGWDVQLKHLIEMLDKNKGDSRQ